MKIVIVGGGTAGTAFARKLRFYNKDVDITLVDKTNNNQYSPCSLPYFIEGKISSVDVYNSYKEDNINFLKQHFPIKRKNNSLVLFDGSIEKSLGYDVLVLATGSKPIIPKIKGLKDFFLLKTKQDAIKLKKITGNTTILGGGYIGLELAFALAKNSDVTIVESKDSLLANYLDKDMSSKVYDYLKKKGINIILNKKITDIKQIKTKNLVISTGFKPDLDILKKLDLKYRPNEKLMIDKNTYLIGDMAKTKNLITNKYEYCMLGSIAQKQGEFLAKNILSDNQKKYGGFIPNSVSKIGDLVIGSVGLTKNIANTIFENIVVSKITTTNKYMTCGGEEYILKIICNSKGLILGCQIIGKEEVAGRLNMVSGFIRSKLTIYDLVKVDTCYNPCVANIKDPLIEAAKIAIKKIEIKYG
ncbi:MAG: FAD-dependent oxidoreductase [Candidatus Woesearchaeota archaeon]